jgi:uncharacterized membrane protein
MQVREAVTVLRPLDEVYNFWLDFENLPRFMSHLESVRVTGNGRSHWKSKGPAGSHVEWDAEVVDAVPNEMISWRSVENADIANSGSVTFVEAPGDRGTEVHVSLSYDPPGGGVGKMVAKLFGEEPGQQVRSDLKRFKQVMETGEVVHSDSSIHKGMHPAQPDEATEREMEAAER